MASFLITFRRLLPVFFSLLWMGNLFAQRVSDVVPGAVRLHNGIILRGMCSSGHSLSVADIPDGHLDLRQIDQGFRAYYVETHRSDPISPDNSVVPSTEYVIPQRSVSRKPMNFEIGLHRNVPFQPDGKSVVSLNLGGGQTVDIQVGIHVINHQFAGVRGLTHRWAYGVSLQAISDATLYAGINQPALLKQVAGFETADTRLNMIQMLIEAEKYVAARLLLEDTQAEFPEVKDRCDRLVEFWNDRVGARVLVELNRLRDGGQHATARRLARNWPDQNIDAVIRVRAASFLNDCEQQVRALETVSLSLNTVLSEIEDPEIRKQAVRMCTALSRELDVNSLSRLSAYELLWKDPALSAESRIALAVTGWLLGADNAIDRFPEANGLFQVRSLVMDYLQTTDDEQSVRDNLLGVLRTKEGFTIERLAQMIAHLPPEARLALQTESENGSVAFSIEPTDQLPRCLGLVPPEYAVTRKYPLLIAMPRGGGSLDATIDWWKDHASRNGFILVVPEIYAREDVNYDSSVEQHRQLLQLVHHIKSGLSVDDDRVFIVGHGMGADAAIDFATSHPDLFAGVVSLAGTGRKHFQWTAHNSPDLPWYLVAGDRQPFYKSRLIPFLRRLMDRVSTAVYCDALFVRYPERGFESFAEELPDLFAWLQRQRRPAFSDTIEATTLKSTDTSWSWLQLSSIDSRFVSMDEASLPDDRPLADTRSSSNRGSRLAFGQVEAEINGNTIRIRSLPGEAELLLSPNLPEIDLGSAIRVIYPGARSAKSIDYKPSARDLLDDFRDRRDRSRLCMMKVPLR